MRTKEKHISLLVIGFIVGLLFVSALRYSSIHPTFLSPLASLATAGYIIVTIAFAILLLNNGLPLNRFGFGSKLDWQKFLLATLAIIALRVYDIGIAPLVEDLVGSPRNLERFSEIKDSTSSLIILLITSWTFAAFGEEFAYRILLMRGISFIFSDTRNAQFAAIIIQAVVFGFAHAYQGPSGIIGSAFTGLVLGSITIKSKWSIWPAAIAHGVNNSIGILYLYFGSS